jgi:hypothetical protein
LQHQRQRHQPLLSSIVQIPLEVATGGIGGLDDPGARRAQFVQLRVRLRLEALVVDGQLRRRADLTRKVALAERGRVVEHQRDGGAIALDRGHGAGATGG